MQEVELYILLYFFSISTAIDQSIANTTAIKLYNTGT
jgi:hypothetical protein